MNIVYNFDGTTIPARLYLLFWLLYVIVFVYAFRKTLLSWRLSVPIKDVHWMFCICFTLYAIFYCINDDYFSYRDWIYGRDFNFWTKEQLYVYIINFCRILPIDYTYEAFRLIIWGGGIFIAYYTYRFYRELLLPGFTLLLLFVFFAPTFCYARASLAMAVYFYGIALFLFHKWVAPKILGICVALFSFYFHHEMLIGVAVLPCLFFPFERVRNSFYFVFLFFITVILLSFFSSNVAFFDTIFDNDVISSQMEIYNEKEQKSFRLTTFVGYLSFFYPLFLISKVFRKNKVPRLITGMYRISYAIAMVSAAFMLVFGLRSVYAYRIMFIMMIPLSILISYCYNNGYFTRKQFLIMIMLALLANSKSLSNVI